MLGDGAWMLPRRTPGCASRTRAGCNSRRTSDHLDHLDPSDQHIASDEPERSHPDPSDARAAAAVTRSKGARTTSNSTARLREGALTQRLESSPSPGDTLPRVVVVLRRDIKSFAELEARLASVGWERRHVPMPASSLLGGEPEHARWARSLDGGDESVLVYTFNPPLALRILSVAGPGAELERRALAKLLPIETEASIAAALSERAPETVLRGIAAAHALDAFSLVALVGLAARHPDRLVAQTAARAHLSMLEGAANTLLVRESWPALEPILAAIADSARPLLSSLPRASDDELLGLKPTEEDCASALAADWAERIFQAYDEQWDAEAPRPRLPAGCDQLQIWACPASLFGRGTSLSGRFPPGYEALGAVLRPGPIWLAWEYRPRGGGDGVGFDGLVYVRSQWVWFPKLFHVIGERLG